MQCSDEECGLAILADFLCARLLDAFQHVYVAVANLIGRLTRQNTADIDGQLLELFQHVDLVVSHMQTNDIVAFLDGLLVLKNQETTCGSSVQSKKSGLGHLYFIDHWENVTGHHVSLGIRFVDAPEHRLKVVFIEIVA